MNKRQKLVQQQFLDNEKAVIDRLKTTYGQSLDDINEKIKGLTFSIGELQEQYDWMDPDDPERAKVKSQIQSKIYQKQYQEQLQRQVDGVLKQMQTKQYTTVSSYLDECYEDGFVGSLFDLHGQGVPLTTPINQEAMVRAVQLDSKISKGLYRRLGEDVDLLKKKITAQVSRSISTGMSYQQTAQALANYTKIGYNNAIRIARTEGHRIQCQSTMDAMASAKDRGADVVKQWDSTLDAKTRESHVAVDMEIRELDKPFSNGLMFPGDPSGGASEVINCRCSLDQRARWALEDDDQSFTKFNGFTGQVEEFESPETYGEFKKAFFSPENRSYMKYVGEMEGKYGKDFPTMLDSMTEREYNHYSKLLKNNPIYNAVGGLTNSSNGGIIDPLDTFNRKARLSGFEDDLANTNPNYSTKEYKWQNNCQRCVPTYELRRRGYNVTAKPQPYMNINDDFISTHPWSVWDNPTLRRFSGKTDIEKAMAAMEDGARVQVSMKYAKKGGHTFVAEKRGDEILFVDPQTGSTDCRHLFEKMSTSRWQNYFWRIDNLKPSNLISECCT